MTDPAVVAQVWEMGIRAEVFEDPLANDVFTFIIDYWRDSQMTKAPTAYVIETERPGYHLGDPAEEDTAWLGRQLMTRFATNRLQAMMLDSAATMHSDPVGTLKALQNTVYTASEVVTPRHSRADMSANVEERRRRYRHQEAHEGVGLTLGLATAPDGCPSLDAWVNGVLPGEIAVVGAYSKVGKTMFLVNAAVEARSQGYTPIIFSLEMPIDEIEGRVDAMFSGVSYDRLSKRRLTPEELETLAEAQDTLSELGPFFVESPEEGERTVAHLTARARHVGADYIIIDQLGFMEETSKCQTEKQRLAQIMKQLKNECSRPGRDRLPCLIAAQLRRESLDRKDGPEMRDFADAAEVERAADHLLALSRNPEQRANRLMRLDILGSRRAEVASWFLRWELDHRTRIEIIERIDNR